MIGIMPAAIKSGREKLAVILTLVIITLLATGFVWAHKKVQIVVDGQNINVNTLYSNPNSVLGQAGIVLGPQDEYRLSTDKLLNGSTIEVFRAVPVTVIYQGKSQVVTTGKPTVGEVAQSLGIPGENIKLEPDGTSKVEAGMQITAITLSEKLVERQVAEPFSVVRRPDATLEKGTEEVVEEGQDGIKTVTVKVHFADGKQVAEEIVTEKVTQMPKAQLIKVGTRDMVETSRGAMRFSRATYMEASAYLPTDGSGAGITASGIPARRGVVAVDPDVIPLGTRLYVDGYGLALAADTGGAIVGNRIDLCMEGYYEAMRFGRRTVKVYILE